MRPFIRFAVATCAVLTAHTAAAQESETAQPAENSVTQPLAMPTPSTVSAPAQTPGRGLTMAQVRDKFGSPANEVPAVGLPPISRWEYPGYVVFFESDRVLHTVIMR